VAATVSQEESYAEKLRSVPELVAFGPLFRSSEPVDLTESETEYVVRCIKHSFPQHLVLQVWTVIWFRLCSARKLSVFWRNLLLPASEYP
jgi:hypothetical protein